MNGRQNKSGRAFRSQWGRTNGSTTDLRMCLNCGWLWSPRAGGERGRLRTRRVPMTVTFQVALRPVFQSVGTFTVVHVKLYGSFIAEMRARFSACQTMSFDFPAFLLLAFVNKHIPAGCRLHRTQNTAYGQPSVRGFSCYNDDALMFNSSMVMIRTCEIC